MQPAPQSLEAEQHILGISILDNYALDESTLQPEHFYAEKHRVLWIAMRTIRARNDGVDITTLIEHLRVNGDLERAGGLAYITGLMDTPATGAYWEAHEKTILDRYHQREIIKVANRATKHAFDLDDPNDILTDLENTITSLKVSKTNDIEYALDSAARYATGEALVKTGFPTLDNAFGGFTRNDLTIIGARSSVGKSAFIHTIADNIAKSEGGPVTIFTPDQPVPEVLAMQAAREARTPLALFRHGKATDKQREAFLSALSGLREGFLKRVNFRPGVLSLESFQMESVRAVRSGATAIIVDTVNRLQAKGDKLHPTIVEFGTIAKGIASEYDIPVIALAQMRRELDWEDRAPTKADLADSPRSLDSDANLMLLLHRERSPDKSSIMNVILEKAKSDEAGGRTLQLFWDAKYGTCREF